MNLKPELTLFAVILLVTQTASALPKIASINLCADSLLLELALPSQIVSVSWLAQDETLSNYAELAKQFPANHGHIEELIPLEPALVFTGANTSAIDKALLLRLGFTVINVLPDRSFDDYENNLRRVGEAIGRREHAERLITKFRNNVLKHKASPARKVNGLIFQANGYSPGVATLPGEMLALVGIQNTSERSSTGGFLSLEELLNSRPDIVVLTSLNHRNPSLADLFLSHPILQSPRSYKDEHAGWRPKTITVEERHLNCGSQFTAQALGQMHDAVKSDFQ